MKTFWYPSNIALCVSAGRDVDGDSRGYRTAEEQARELTRCIRREVSKLSEKWNALIERSDQWQRKLDDSLSVSVFTTSAQNKTCISHLQAEIMPGSFNSNALEKENSRTLYDYYILSFLLKINCNFSTWKSGHQWFANMFANGLQGNRLLKSLVPSADVLH